MAWPSISTKPGTVFALYTLGLAMENFREIKLSYSLKSIPIANERDYKFNLTSKVEQFLGRIR